MSKPYAVVVEVQEPMARAIERLRIALATEHMGIVSEIDVQGILKGKLGIDTYPQRLLGICGPKLAHELLTAEPDIGALLPCGCSVAERAPGHTRIALQDPLVIAASSANSAVHKTLQAAHASIARVAAALGAAG